MRLTKIVCSVAVVLLLGMTVAQAQPQPGAQKKLYNAAKQKLLDGKPIWSATVGSFDPQGYCNVAPHYDWVFIDMQHSTLSWAEVEKMIGTCPGAGVPIIRLPDELESTIQKAMDIGALGVLEPTVDTVEKAEAVARFTHYPPEGHRSNGRSQASSIYTQGGAYRQTANDNIIVMVMIETPVGVANAYDIARVRGIDVVVAANNDLGSFSGYGVDDPRYLDMFVKIRDAALKAGKFFGVTNVPWTEAHPDLMKDVKVAQGGPSKDGWQPPARAGRGGAKKEQ